ncbi:hypothetical protein Prudu_004245 [Prunus dulcis]|uniref:Uncharacterized protein n=1 Tax=Prunus dulcis TaxID=3755 RepID=A0A4Y1QUV7_PRUDU|nr:hypothetical protein Prudu_004245 [Prunus dulcis]
MFFCSVPGGWCCLCLDGGDSSDAGFGNIDASGSCWDVVLFFTLRQQKNYAWSYERWVFFSTSTIALSLGKHPALSLKKPYRSGIAERGFGGWGGEDVDSRI